MPKGVQQPAAWDLLAAYLDRRHPRWREDAQGDAATARGKMTKEEVYQILGAQDRGAVDSGCLRPGDEGIGHVGDDAGAVSRHWPAE